MNYSRTLTPICSLLATALLAFAQPPTPRPASGSVAARRLGTDSPCGAAPGGRADGASASNAADAGQDIGRRVGADSGSAGASSSGGRADGPDASGAARAAGEGLLGRFRFRKSIRTSQVKIEMAREQVEMAREQAERMKFEFAGELQWSKRQMMAAKEMAMADMRSKFNFAFAPQGSRSPTRTPMPAKAYPRHERRSPLFGRAERARQSPVGSGPGVLQPGDLAKHGAGGWRALTGRPTRWANSAAATKPTRPSPNCASPTPAAAGWMTPRRWNWN